MNKVLILATLLLLSLVAPSRAAFYFNGTSPATAAPEDIVSGIPLPVDYWLPATDLEIYTSGVIDCPPADASADNLPYAGEIAICRLNLDFHVFEDILDHAHKHQLAAVIFETMLRPGEGMYSTNGRSRFAPQVNVFEVSILEITRIPIGTAGLLTFHEGNVIHDFDRSPLWIILTLVIYLPLVVFAVILAAYRLWFFMWKAKEDGTTVITIANSALTLEIIANIVRFINGTNLNNSNLLFHWIVNRVLFTLHLPITLTTSLLLALYTQVVARRAKKLTRGSTSFLSSMKIPFFVIIGFLFVLEIFMTISGITFAIAITWWVIPVLIVYIVADVFIGGLYIFVNIKVRRAMKAAEVSVKSERRQKMMTRLMTKLMASVVGIVGWLVMLALQFLTAGILDNGTYIYVSRLTGLAGFFFVMTQSYAHILSFVPPSEFSDWSTTRGRHTTSGKKTSSKASSALDHVKTTDTTTTTHNSTSSYAEAMVPISNASTRNSSSESAPPKRKKKAKVVETNSDSSDLSTSNTSVGSNSSSSGPAPSPKKSSRRK